MGPTPLANMISEVVLETGLSGLCIKDCPQSSLGYYTFTRKNDDGSNKSWPTFFVGTKFSSQLCALGGDKMGSSKRTQLYLCVKCRQ